VAGQNIACYVCGQIAGDPARDLIAQFLPGSPYIRRVVLDTESFAAVPSLGPLAAGHLLLCPRTHLPSAAALLPRAHAEYESVKAALAARLTDIYQAPVHVFEHGMAASGGRTVCTVDHAHVHFVPLPEPVGCLGLTGPEWLEFDGSLATLAALTRGREYVMYAAPGRASRVCVGRAPELESQFMRRAIARALGRQTWDWRTTPHPELAHRTWLQCASNPTLPLQQ